MQFIKFACMSISSSFSIAFPARRDMPSSAYADIYFKHPSLSANLPLVKGYLPISESM
jgi:hypothetical protein